MSELALCLVCDRPTDQACAACSLQYYCSSECQEKDFIYHQAECGEQSIDALLGVAEWKTVTSEHMALIMERNWAIGRKSQDTLLSAQNRLTANTAKWMRVRSAMTKELQGKIVNFNAKVKEAMEDLRANNMVKYELAKDSLGIAARMLANFFAEKKFLTRSIATKRDYDQAFMAYVSCIIEHAESIDKLLQAKASDEIQIRKTAMDRIDEKCHKIALALGAVLNGRQWSLTLAKLDPPHTTL